MTRIGFLISAARWYFKFDQTAVRADLILSAVHYKLAFGVVLGCSILTGFTSWYSPIECTKPDAENIDMGFVKQWCYANSTYLVEGPAAKEGISYGVLNKYSRVDNGLLFISYYQWVTLCLFMQASSFQVPCLLWNYLENGKVRKIVEKLNSLEFVAESECLQQMSRLAAVFWRSKANITNYFRSFIFYQLLYITNALVQVALTNSFLQGRFLELFPRWIFGYSTPDSVFPKMVKCRLQSYGSGGSAQDINVLCILSINVLNERLYLVVWLVYMIVIISCIGQMAFIVQLLSFRHFQHSQLCLDSTLFSNDELSFSFSRGSWLVLKFVQDNIDDPLLFDKYMMAIKNHMV